jgi:putative transcriptional regulator
VGRDPARDRRDRHHHLPRHSASRGRCGKARNSLLVALGYAGWGPGQLERELAENSWLSGPADFDILFHTLANDLRWLAAAALLGIDLNLLSADVGHA